nr:7-deoxyloganetic acid glucosyltransferase [Quercus suber]
MEFIITEASAMKRASTLILNTFEELEAPIIARLGSFFDKIYAIGPLHALSKTRIKDSSQPISSYGILRKEDSSCLAWPNSQPLSPVIYVSFGSVVGLSRDQLMEFWHGLVNSGKPFLWVVRPDWIEGNEELGQISEELEQGTKERGYMVSWAPQEEVLAHLSVAGFLTHNGWNSTLESIFEGVPIICWPQLADQQVNSRCVSELWRVGFDMKDTCDRFIIKKMVRDLIENKREEIMRSMNEIAKRLVVVSKKAALSLQPRIKG